MDDSEDEEDEEEEDEEESSVDRLRFIDDEAEEAEEEEDEETREEDEDDEDDQLLHRVTTFWGAYLTPQEKPFALDNSDNASQRCTVHLRLATIDIVCSVIGAVDCAAELCFQLRPVLDAFAVAILFTFARQSSCHTVVLSFA